MKKIGIVLNVYKPETLEITHELLGWLIRKGLDVSFLRFHADKLGCPERGVAEEELAKESDLLIALGGDGTLLSAARIAAPRETPILGVNLGDFGFLVTVEPQQMYEHLLKVLDGNFTSDSRMMLESRVYRGGEPVDQSYALNDVVITKGAFSRVIRLETYVAGEFVNNYPADGIILSSPTGSTAYALSAGGPIVSPKVDVIILTPICPHTLYTRPLVISPEEQVRVILKAECPEVMLTVDGQYGFTLQKGDEVLVERASFRTNLVRVPGRSFYDVMREKLRRGEHEDE